MPTTQTILQHPVLTRFAWPFLLIFFIVFGILEKTKLFGEDKKQTNALVAFVIGLIFISVAYPGEVVTNLILFLTVAIVVMFIALLLWGFVSGSDMKEKILDNKAVKWIVGIGVVIAVVIALLFATGVDFFAYDLLFGSPYSSELWTNVIFIVVIAAALALVLRKTN